MKKRRFSLKYLRLFSIYRGVREWHTPISITHLQIFRSPKSNGHVTPLSPQTRSHVNDSAADKGGGWLQTTQQRRVHSSSHSSSVSDDKYMCLLPCPRHRECLQILVFTINHIIAYWFSSYEWDTELELCSQGLDWLLPGYINAIPLQSAAIKYYHQLCKIITLTN